MIKYPISVKKKQYFEEKHMDLLLGEEGKMNYVLIKNFNTFMYDYTLHCGRKQYCHFCLLAISTEKNIKMSCQRLL